MVEGPDIVSAKRAMRRAYSATVTDFAGKDAAFRANICRIPQKRAEKTYLLPLYKMVCHLLYYSTASISFEKSDRLIQLGLLF